MTDRPILRRTAGWWLIPALLLGALGAAWLILGSSAPARAAGALLQTDSEYAEIYAQQCAACHGDAGEGGIGGPLLDSTLDIPGRISIITEGQGGMPAYGLTLDADQIEGVSIYLDDLAIGAIYAQQCGPCHGPSGEGTDNGSNLQTSTLTGDARLQIITEGAGAMPGFAQTLSADQLQDLADFVVSFVSADTVGGAIWTSQCGPCHGESGEGGVADSIQESTTPFDDVVAVVTNGAGAMPGFGPTLTPEEIQVVSRYAESLRTTPPVDQPEPPDDGNEAGAAAYETQCAFCHGADGSGGAGPPLIGTQLSMSDLGAIIANGRGSMPGFSDSLSADDLDAVTQFVADLGGGGATGGEGDVSPIARGAVVYTENCALCHGPDASGGSAAGLQNSTLSSAELEAAIVDGIGTMPGFGSLIAGEDLAATVAYLEARIAAEGGATPSDTTAGPDPTGIVGAAGALQAGRVVYASSCATCHGATGEGGVGNSLVNSTFTVNEIVSQIYGGHEDGMPAFEGVLDPADVQNVARFVLSLEGEGDSGGGIGRVLVILALAAAILVGIVYLVKSGWLRTARRT